MDNTTNALNWFEIPATDINRSKAFYETIFDITMELMDMEDNKMAFFPFEDGKGKASGSLVQSPNHKPSMEGSVIYLNANPNLSTVLSKIEAAGGKILMPKTAIGEFGNMAFFMDTEGNNVGLHSIE
ncbi:VOC family protein [Flavobacteriaceae bacterium]|nr:VOC family protein [Flavobacteriaceae bacterium]